jgi:hypothetical protein
VDGRITWGRITSHNLFWAHQRLLINIDLTLLPSSVVTPAVEVASVHTAGVAGVLLVCFPSRGAASPKFLLRIIERTCHRSAVGERGRPARNSQLFFAKCAKFLSFSMQCNAHTCMTPSPRRGVDQTASS